MLATHGTNLPIIKEKASWKLLEFVYNFLSIPSMLVNFHNALRSIIISSIKCLNFIYIYIYIVHPHSWILGLNLTWARSNLDSQLTCMVGLSFLLQVILGRNSMRSLFSLSSLNFFLFFLNPLSSPISLIYSSKLVGDHNYCIC